MIGRAAVSDFEPTPRPFAGPFVPQPEDAGIYFLAVAFRLPATVFRAPRLVRAFVLVRCP
jgi:hypothetical protein